MKYKTCELTGALLDCATALAGGIKAKVFSAEQLGPDSNGKVTTGDTCCIAGRKEGFVAHYSPSSNKEHGQPIVEYMLRRKRAQLIASGSDWPLDIPLMSADSLGTFMRAFVAHKFGDEVEF